MASQRLTIKQTKQRYEGDSLHWKTLNPASSLCQISRPNLIFQDQVYGLRQARIGVLVGAQHQTGLPANVTTGMQETANAAVVHITLPGHPQVPGIHMWLTLVVPTMRGTTVAETILAPEITLGKTGIGIGDLTGGSLVDQTTHGYPGRTMVQTVPPQVAEDMMDGDMMGHIPGKLNGAVGMITEETENAGEVGNASTHTKNGGTESTIGDMLHRLIVLHLYPHAVVSFPGANRNTLLIKRHQITTLEPNHPLAGPGLRIPLEEGGHLPLEAREAGLVNHPP
jgi:hypothetical protein